MLHSTVAVQTSDTPPRCAVRTSGAEWAPDCLGSGDDKGFVASGQSDPSVLMNRVSRSAGRRRDRRRGRRAWPSKMASQMRAGTGGRPEAAADRGMEAAALLADAEGDQLAHSRRNRQCSERPVP